MNLFGIQEAHHYCSSFTATAGDSENSIETFRNNYLQNQRILI